MCRLTRLAAFLGVFALCPAVQAGEWKGVCWSPHANYFEERSDDLDFTYSRLNVAAVRAVYYGGKPAYSIISNVDDIAFDAVTGLGSGPWGVVASVVMGQGVDAAVALLRDVLETPQHLAVEIGGRTMDRGIRALNENNRFFRRGISELDDAAKLRFRQNQVYVDLMGPGKRLYLSAKDGRSASSVDPAMLNTLSAVESILAQTTGLGSAATLVEIVDVLRQAGIDLESYGPYQDYQRGVTAAQDANGIIPCMNEEPRSGPSSAGSWEELLKEASGSSGVTKTDPEEAQSLARAGTWPGDLNSRGRPEETGVFDGIEFVWIPPGEFRMGSTSRHAVSAEKPVTRVRISRGYWLGKYEVTQGQWESVMGSNRSYFNYCGEDCPVEDVSWNDVQAFLRKLNARSGGRRYRLPTEAEWEYAARGGTNTDTYAGDLRIQGRRNTLLLDGIAWYRGNSGVRYQGGRDCSTWKGKQYGSNPCGPQPVGEKAPNWFGLHDILGNAWEWVGDWHGDYPGGRVTNPAGPRSGSSRVVRGGGWNAPAEYCRSANRDWKLPGYRSDRLGFRLLRTE